MRSVLLVCLMLLAGVAATDGREPNRIAEIFQNDMLPVRVAYLETITGPARRILPSVWGRANEREYRVGGCALTAFVDHDEVQAYRIELSPACTFDLTRMIPNFPKVSANNLTFGMLSNYHAAIEFLPACLISCGASAYTYELADPGYSIFVQTPHSDGYIEIVATAFDENKQALDAAGRLRVAALRLMPEQDIDAGRFFCDPKYSELGIQIFQNVRIQEITIGYGLRPKRAHCSG